MEYDLARERAGWSFLVGLTDEEAIIELDNFYCERCMGCEYELHTCHLDDAERAERDLFHVEMEKMLLTMRPGEVRRFYDGRLMHMRRTNRGCRVLDWYEPGLVCKVHAYS